MNQSSEIIVAPSYDLSAAFIDKETGRLAISPEALAKRDKLVLAAKEITEVKSVEDRDNALAAAGRIKKAINTAESDRKEFKDVFWKMCKAIDATEQFYVADLISENNRLNRIAGVFEAARLEKIRVEQEKIEAERRRVQKEADDAVAEAERKRQELEASKSRKKGKSKLEIELELQEAQEEAQAKKAALDIQQMTTAETGRAAAPTGATMNYDYAITVFDAHALRMAYPQCVKLVPDLVEIKVQLRAGVTLPGITYTKTPILRAGAR